MKKDPRPSFKRKSTPKVYRFLLFPYYSLYRDDFFDVRGTVQKYLVSIPSIESV